MNNAPPRHQPNGEPSRRSSNVQNINTSTKNDKGDTAQLSQDPKRKTRAVEIPNRQSTIQSRAKLGASKVSIDQESDVEDTDSDESLENLVTTGRRAKPSKFERNGKKNGKKGNMVLEEDIYEDETSSEKSDQSSPNSSPRGIALPSDDGTPELGDEYVTKTTSSFPEWTEEDQILLDCTYDYELALWRRTRVLFNCAPFDLFPTGIKATSDHWEGYKYKDEFIKNESSLTIPFCKSFCTLVCFPHFDDDIEFVKYALSTALKARCEDQIPNALEGMNTWSTFTAQYDGLFEDMNRAEIYFTQAQRLTFKKILASRTSLLGLPRNSAFVDTKIFKEILKSTRTAKEKGDSIHLLNGDIQNVIKAWDIWNKDSKKNIPSMEESKDSWQKGNGKAMKVPRGIVLGWKKDWILEKRRRDAIDMNEGNLGIEDGVIISEDENTAEDDEENQRLEEIEKKILEIEKKRLEMHGDKRGKV
ncbi:uncharacterized protein EAE97_004003 [Botrytis byssoidea]|uniref:Uncharacterized protein n=1 Tax=Botrytis byssoidea TaxID=139641 RepID=A0A9P5IP32_9HELO|nr:uncharacterized protein EAE97_004003 [Botrytis byssoidea]KAF7948592.1 hypothetical protein EAE97_004003 [Botrytis byssoidea]